ncbi:MAG: N-carbamoylputrescine amidase [Lachnospiraceae bacterium]|nr:N-carbamoylputrescine amidase [Lachnospiraceae bacterium]
MRNLNLSVCQMQMTDDVNENICKADKLVREAAEKGANVILLPELFERPYFCQERRYDFYEYAKTVDEDPAVIHFCKTAKELHAVIPVSFYEKAGTVLYNSIAMINADGSLMGVYRKTHIPDDHFYQEKFYFTPGDTGFKVWDTEFGKIGTGICWDQWFPEAARCMALKGAEVLLYPTAIGSEPVLETDSMPHWRRCMQGHAGCNLMPLAAANRIGKEAVKPCPENNEQSSELIFYGSSFICDETGDIKESAGRDKEEVLVHSFDLDEISELRMSWGVFRDRRPGMYKTLSGQE